MTTEPALAFDLAKTCFTRTFGDITVLGTWFGPKGEPCIVLMRIRDIGKPGVVPCVVLLSDAWKWGDDGDVRYQVRVSMDMADMLGMNRNNQFSVMRVTKAINETLGDLLTIPPKPKFDQITVADVIRKDEYGKEHHTELREDV